jgi:peptidase E
MGAGKAVLTNRDSPLHEFILGLAAKSLPSVLFVPTAVGDDPAIVAKFYETFTPDRCVASHLSLFLRDLTDIRRQILSHDIIWVSGGNTANMLAIWKLHGVDEHLRDAFDAGAILTGGSAGGLCWFEGGPTDSFGPRLTPITNGLGLLKGSFCPHYDGDKLRRPVFHKAILSGLLPSGYAAGEFDALHFEGTELTRAVSAGPTPHAFRVSAVGGEIIEEPIPTLQLT